VLDIAPSEGVFLIAPDIVLEFPAIMRSQSGLPLIQPKIRPEN